MTPEQRGYLADGFRPFGDGWACAHCHATIATPTRDDETPTCGLCGYPWLWTAFRPPVLRETFCEFCGMRWPLAYVLDQRRTLTDAHRCFFTTPGPPCLCGHPADQHQPSKTLVTRPCTCVGCRCHNLRLDGGPRRHFSEHSPTIAFNPPHPPDKGPEEYQEITVRLRDVVLALAGLSNHRLISLRHREHLNQAIADLEIVRKERGY